MRSWDRCLLAWLAAAAVACGSPTPVPAPAASEPTANAPSSEPNAAPDVDAAHMGLDASAGEDAAPRDAGSEPPESSAPVRQDAAAGGADEPILQASSEAVAELEAHLAEPRGQRPVLEAQPFAQVPLTRADAERAVALLWEDYADHVRETRADEMGASASRAASLTLDGSTLRYYQSTHGEEPEGGRSLFISMHGGGNAPAATNDAQWENQIALADGYAPQDAIWVAPRAPSNEWNMWFTEDVDALFDRLITNFIVFEGVNPNRIYLTGYSAGGDAVYQLGPRMADRWAAAAMSAGHPNAAAPDNLRNVPFAIHVGGNDTAYERNEQAAIWGRKLEELAAEDGEGGYPNQWEVHPGLPHWMNLADAVAIPFVQSHTRDPVPPIVVWRQADVLHPRLYWLAVDPADARKDARVVARYAGDTVTLSEVTDVPRLTVRFTEDMLDLNAPVHIVQDGTTLFSGPVPRSIGVIERTLQERGDPSLVFYGEVTVELH